MNLATTISFPNLHINIEKLPKSFSLFGFDIAFYGVIMGLAMLAGVAIACWQAKRTGQNYNNYIDFALYGIFFSVLGARTYYVIFKWDYYKNNLGEIINVREGGLAIYGAVIAAALTCFIYTRIKKMNFGLVADTGVFGLILGQVIGRWGNFFNREAFGQVVSDNYLFAMRLYFDDNYSISQVPDSVRTSMELMRVKTLEKIGYIQVQPTFLYESLWNLFILILMIIFHKKKKFNGEIMLWYLFGYGAGRFVIEGFRTDQLIMPFTGWPVSQFLSAVLVVVSLTIIIIKRRKCKKVEA